MRQKVGGGALGGLESPFHALAAQVVAVWKGIESISAML